MSGAIIRVEFDGEELARWEIPAPVGQDPKLVSRGLMGLLTLLAAALNRPGVMAYIKVPLDRQFQLPPTGQSKSTSEAGQAEDSKSSR